MLQKLGLFMCISVLLSVTKISLSDNCFNVSFVEITLPTVIVHVHVPWPQSWINKIRDKLTDINVTDTNLAFILENQLHYCPTVSMCSISIKPDFSTNLPCCKQCSCDPDCLDRGTCCPDVFIKTYFFDKPVDTCVRPQFRRYMLRALNSERAYYMRSKCLNYFSNKTIKDFCENLHVHPKTFPRFLSHVPVTSNVSGVTYRNIYCALCNSEKEGDQIQWDSDVSCLNKLSVFPKSLEFLLNYLEKEKECNIMFYRSMKIESHPIECDWGLFTECNQTGEIDYYDSRLEYGCQSYTSIYKGIYRNVHCFMCNSNSNPQISGCSFHESNQPFDIAAFTALLNFRVFEEETNYLPMQVSSSRISDTICLSKEKYDAYKNVCRHIDCSDGFIYTNNTCKRIYSRERFKSYEVYFRLRLENNCLLDTSCFKFPIFSYIQGKFALLELPLCRINIIINVNNSYCNRSEFNDQAYLLIHVQFGMTSYHKLEDVINKVLSLQNETIQIGENSCIPNTSKKLRINLDGGDYGSNVHFGQSNTEYMDPITSKILPIDTSYSLSMDMSCGSPLRLVRVMNNTLCPRVILSKTEFNFTFSTDKICINEIDLCFKSGYYTDSAKSITVCSEDYFSHISDIVRENSNTSQNETKPNTTRENVCGTSVQNPLNATTFVCISLSIVSLFITLTIYCLFKDLRTIPGKNNMLLAVNLLIAQLLFLFGSGQHQLGVGCQIIGLFLHSFWLSSLFMMSSCTIHMVRVFVKLKKQTTLTKHGTNSVVMKYAIYSYTSTAFFVLVNIIVSLVKTSGKDFGYGGCICYISSKLMIGLTFALPVGLIVLSNIIFFIVVIIKIQTLPHIDNSTGKHRNVFLIYIKLSCLTGLTWIVGFMNELIPLDAFAYLFIILNAGQGLYMMMAFVCNKRVVRLISSWCKTKQCVKEHRKYRSSTTNSTSVSRWSKSTLTSSLNETPSKAADSELLKSNHTSEFYNVVTHL